MKSDESCGFMSCQWKVSKKVRIATSIKYNKKRIHVLVGEFNTIILTGLIMPLPRNFYMLSQFTFIFQTQKTWIFSFYGRDDGFLCVTEPTFFCSCWISRAWMEQNVTDDEATFHIFLYDIFFPRSPFSRIYAMLLCDEN